MSLSKIALRLTYHSVISDKFDTCMYNFILCVTNEVGVYLCIPNLVKQKKKQTKSEIWEGKMKTNDMNGI